MGAINLRNEDHFTTEVEVDSYQLEELFGLNGEQDAIIKILDVDITWRVDLDVRSWGIKDIVAIVPDQAVELEFEAEVYDEKEDDLILREGSKAVFLKNIEVKFESELTVGSSIAPKTLEYDNGKWILVF